MSASTPSGSLVVVALDPTEREDYAIELASRLVPTATPELLGLFIENAQLLEHARSRWAREVLLTGTERALDRATLERQLRVQAARARARFETVSARLGLRHRFEVARGDVFAEAIRRASAAGALVLSVTRAMDAAGFWPGRILGQLVEVPLPLVLLARAGWLSGDSIVVIANEAGATETMLEQAARLASPGNTPVAVLVPTSAKSNHAALEAQIAEALRLHRVENSNVIALPGATAAEVVLAASAFRPRLLVAPSPSEPNDSALIETLLRRLPGALMLVRPRPER
jgi:hypothetical protein